MLKIGLTGGIGAGKSTVAAFLDELGAFIIDADQLAREVVAPGTTGFADIVRRFGNDVVQADGSLDRAALARHIFADDGARRDLEKIIHPRVRARAKELAAAQDEETIVVEDIPLLVETRAAPRFHLVIDVEAPDELRLERLQERGMAAEDARRRMASQASEVQRREACDVVIDNSGDLELVKAEVRRLWAERIVPAANNLAQERAAIRPEKLHFVEPDPEWAHQFERIAARLRFVLGPNALRIDHVGSTAIWGLKAKPIIDVQVTVLRLSVVDSYVKQLNRSGFFGGSYYDEPKPEYPDKGVWEKRLYLSIDPGNLTHIHIRQANSPGQEFALLFRDWLRSDTVARQEYAQLKDRLASHYGSTTEYAVEKEPWFTDIAWPRARAWAAESGWRPPLC